MEKKRKWKLMILPASLFLLAFGLYAGYTMWEQGNLQGVKGNSDSSNLKNGGQTVAVFQEESEHENYSTVGSFIHEFHIKYNDTLGWGRIDSVEWEEQREIASEIIAVLATVKTDNTALQADFDTISNYSRTIEEGNKDKKILLQLHRYFHDLDIEFNSYNKTNDYFNVTKYKDPENG
ncbi:hypothetical protein LC048_07800 [Mesobacillus subterraneus]|uniref:hypothetical protein n=1 Tax=Mesobacillus subterraneus TaxID=285983 RepID=UPI001CFCB84C|nr:hypothetical protein [Mesobacillus subterraneus]WLR56772.1 hypothetical protein LC048_07800 [Mesobacillus subterraneus]